MAIETILLTVGAGDTERIDKLTEETIDVAGSTGTTVVIGYVSTKDGYDDTLDNPDSDTTAEEVPTDDVARRHTTVHELTCRFDDANIDYIIRGRADHHGKKLVELAGEVDAGRLVVGGRKRSPTGKTVFGNVAQEVTLEASYPVALVRADTKRRIAATQSPGRPVP